ncbi:MAG: penicillin-binding protein 1A [Pseudomonadota bacterium]
MVFSRFLGFLFSAATILFLGVAAVVAYAIWYFDRDLPNYDALKNYEPPVTTRFHASDGTLIAEYAAERRLYIPIQAVPKLVINAFIAAEDKNFWKHQGIDPEGVLRAAVNNFRNWGDKRPEGASTITQQVAKNFLVGNETSYGRKVREALVSMRIEAAYSKEKILELYLNEIFLGFNSYGIASAALAYFDKSVQELTLQEVAYLAALPKGPNNYHPFRFTDKAIERRNYVIDRMVEDGYATAAEGEKAKATPLGVAETSREAHMFQANYFSEDVRRELVEKYGEDKLYKGGLSVRTTIDPKLQVIARKVLMDGLVAYDQKQGWRGPVEKIVVPAGKDWGALLSKRPMLNDVTPWRMAVVLSVSPKEAKIGLRPNLLRSGSMEETRETATITIEGAKWARPAEGPHRYEALKSMENILAPGDVIYVEPSDKNGQYELKQVPQIEGGMVAMDPYTGRVLAMVGGFSFSESVFNRASQAYRQPGSSFKPIVYATALDNGYTPSSIILDTPYEKSQGPGLPIWRPQNYDNKFYGPSTLRTGVERSRNVMTVRLAEDLGMPLVAEYARRFGIYDDLPQVLSMALGAGETTVMRMVTGYSMIANGGRRIKGTLIDRIQDRYGHTIYKHDARVCPDCNAPKWTTQNEPMMIDKRDQVIDSMTAFQITSIMEGVIQRGTGTAIKAVGKPLAGKTGTTNDEKDAWFVGFSPDLVMGLYVGYDQPKPLGKGQTGGVIAAPMFRDFMKEALAGKPATPFRVPPGIKLVRVDARTGTLASGDSGRVILEAFKPDQSPPSSFYGGGYVQDEQGGWGPRAPAPPADGGNIGSGTGGLY